MIDIIARALAAQAAQGGKGSAPQDLTANALASLTAAEWRVLKNVTLIKTAASVTGLDPEYSFIKVKITIDSTDYECVLLKNTSSNYTGEINVTEGDYLYQIDVIFNGNDELTMKSTSFVVLPDDTLYNDNGEALFDVENEVLTTTED